MPSERHEQAVARAQTARRRAREARRRAELYLQRGDDWLAQVEESVARTHDLIVTNSELLIARLTRPEPAYRTPSEKIEAARAGERTALAYARIHRDRGQITRAHYHEKTAATLAMLAAILEADITETQPPTPSSNGRPQGDFPLTLDAPDLIT